MRYRFLSVFRDKKRPIASIQVIGHCVTYSILNLPEINTQEIAETAKEDAVLFF